MGAILGSCRPPPGSGAPHGNAYVRSAVARALGLRDDDHTARPLRENGLKRLPVQRGAVAIPELHHKRSSLDRPGVLGDDVAGLAGPHALHVTGNPQAADQLRPLDLALRLALLGL